MDKMDANFVWFDGEFIPLEKARAYFNSNPRYQAPSVVEGMRCYETERGAAVFRLQEHVDHFVERVHQMGFTLDAYRDLSLTSAVLRTIIVNNLSECHVRLQLFMEMPLYPHGTDDIRPKILITATALNTDPLKLSVDGYEADFTGEIMFVVADNVIFVEPEGDTCDTVARATAIELIKEFDHNVIETIFSAELQQSCDEAFAVSTQNEIRPVTTLAETPISSVKAQPITAAVQALYSATARGETRQSLGWVDYVTMEPLF
jgi:branched-chain amino acid aminotransferase